MRIEFSTSSPAFHCPDEYNDIDLDRHRMSNEIYLICIGICNDIKHGKTEGVLTDSYENVVGSWKL